MKDGVFVSIISVRAVMLFTEIPLCLSGPYGRLQALEGDVTITLGRPALSSVPSNKPTVHMCPIYLKAIYGLWITSFAYHLCCYAHHFQIKI